VYVPSSATTLETFVWYQAAPGVQLGIAHLLKQNAFRFLASVRAWKETASIPALNLSIGVQGIGVGNPGYAATFEKNWSTRAGSFNIYSGIGLRSNESHGHVIGGMKFSPDNFWSFGLQEDGHQTNPFVTYAYRNVVIGLYLIDCKTPATMVGVRF